MHEPPFAPFPLVIAEVAGDTALDGFAVLVAALARGGDAVDSAAWNKLLASQLAGLQPVQRAQFEQQLAQRLADGWLPGHDMLFPAAVAQFGWAEEGANLARLGNAGVLLGQAIAAGRVFSQQGPSLRAAQYALYARLRDVNGADGGDGATPGMDELARLGPQLAALAGPLGALTHVIADAGALTRWQQAEQSAMQRVAHMPAGQVRWLRWQPVLVWVAILLGLAWLLSLAMDESAGQGEQIVEQQLAGPADANLAEIQSRIHYTRPAHLQGMPLSVEYRVTLNADRTVQELTKVLASIDPDFDEAVAQAIRAAPAFPANTVLSFTVRFNIGRQDAPNAPRQVSV